MLTKYLFTLFILLTSFYLSCDKTTDSFSNQNVLTTTKKKTQTDTVNFYLSDTLGSVRTQFNLGEDIIFNLDIYNFRDSLLTFSKSHGGPPIARFLVYSGDSLFGVSDEGYAYPAILGGGAIVPNDTLEFSVSWYFNPYHQNAFVIGEYYTIVKPYIWFEDFNLISYLDTVYFEIVEE